MGDAPAAGLEPLAEASARLDLIARLHPGSRLEVDMARDAIRDVGRQVGLLAGKLRRARRRRRKMRGHARQLLDAVAGVPVPPWPVPAPNALEPLAEAYHRMHQETLPALARELHASAGRGEARDYLLMLSEEVMRRGQRTLVEVLTCQPGVGRAVLCERARPVLGGHLTRVLARQAGYRLTPGIGQAADVALRQVLALLDGLLHTAPAARLYWVEQGASFDPARHERGSGKPGTEERLVRATLLPGLWLPAEGRVIEKAIVATHRPGE